MLILPFVSQSEKDCNGYTVCKWHLTCVHALQAVVCAVKRPHEGAVRECIQAGATLDTLVQCQGHKRSVCYIHQFAV